MTLKHALTLSIALLSAPLLAETIPVTGDNFARAESARNFANWAKLGSDQAIFHYRDLSPVGPSAPTVRMNWDTLYSNRIVKVSDDGTFAILLPETDLYVSAHVIDENGFAPYFLVEKGKPQEVKVDTDYAWVLFRTEVENRKDPASIERAHTVQDGLQITGTEADSTYTEPPYDQDQLAKLRAQYTQEFLDSGEDFTYAKGPGRVDQHTLNLSHAAGWGGMEPELHVSNIYSSSETFPGTDCRQTTFDDPGNRFFTSFTLYGEDNYLMAGETHTKSDLWTANDDGTVTLHFNCGADALNNLNSGGKPFNYTIRSYGVSQKVLDGDFKPVHPEIVN